MFLSRQSLFCSSVSVSSYALEGDGFLKTQIHVDVHAFVVQHRQSKHSGLPDWHTSHEHIGILGILFFLSSLHRHALFILSPPHQVVPHERDLMGLWTGFEVSSFYVIVCGYLWRTPYSVWTTFRPKLFPSFLFFYFFCFVINEHVVYSCDKPRDDP